MQFILANSN